MPICPDCPDNCLSCDKITFLSSDDTILVTKSVVGDVCNFDIKLNLALLVQTEDTSTIAITGNGSSGDKLSASVKISTNPLNQLTVDSEGLLVLIPTINPGLPNLKTDTATATVTLSGTDNKNIQVDVNVSATAGNTLTINPDGLYASSNGVKFGVAGGDVTAGEDRFFDINGNTFKVFDNSSFLEFYETGLNSEIFDGLNTAQINFSTAQFYAYTENVSASTTAIVTANQDVAYLYTTGTGVSSLLQTSYSGGAANFMLGVRSSGILKGVYMDTSTNILKMGFGAGINDSDFKGIQIDSAKQIYFDTVANDNAEDKLLTWNSTDKKIEYRTVASLGVGADTHFGNTNLTQTAARTYAGGSFDYTLNALGEWNFNMSSGYGFYVNNAVQGYLGVVNGSTSGWIDHNGDYVDIYQTAGAAKYNQIFAKSDGTNTYGYWIQEQSGVVNTITLFSGGTFGSYNTGITIEPSSGNLYIKNLTNLSTQNRLIGQYGTDGHIGHITVGSGLDLTSGILTATVTAVSNFWTPTLTNNTNISSSTAYLCKYMRVGDVVTCSGKVTVDPTAAGLCELSITLPIASATSVDYEVAGTGACAEVAGFCAAIKGVPASDVAMLTWTAVDTASRDVFFHFTYSIQYP